LTASEVTSEFLSGRIVGIEVWVPSVSTSTSAQWAADTTRNLRTGHKTEGIKTKTALADLLEAESKKAVKAGQLKHALKASYLENQLGPWGIWPLSEEA
jgi:hypothetical protein